MRSDEFMVVQAQLLNWQQGAFVPSYCGRLPNTGTMVVLRAYCLTVNGRVASSSGINIVRLGVGLRQVAAATAREGRQGRMLLRVVAVEIH